jgi:antitoxin component YwqK of YwqJK toxin-antitoxin module
MQNIINRQHSSLSQRFKLILSFAAVLMLVVCSHAQPATTSPKDELTFKTDTINVRGDSAFVIINGFYNDTLAFQYGNIFLPHSCIFHGRSTYWHKNGMKKAEGTYTFGKKNNDWKFWDAEGKEISEAQQKEQNKN